MEGNALLLPGIRQIEYGISLDSALAKELIDILVCVWEEEDLERNRPFKIPPDLKKPGQ